MTRYIGSVRIKMLLSNGMSSIYSESNIQIVRPQKTKSQVIESQKIASSRSIVGAAG
ncbi:hypothetical protein [Bradyrhizobium sp. URHC0002]